MKFLIAISLLLAPALCATTLPVGTELHLRLTAEASSNQQSGSSVSAVVIAPVFVNGVPALSAGTKVTGDIADARPYQAATAQAAEQTAALRIQFTRIEDRAGHSTPLSSVVESVDNARETVDDSGLISGIAESQTFEARMDQGIGKLASRYQGFASVLSAVEGSLVKHVDPSIDYKPGVELTVKLTKALAWNGPATGINIREIEPAAALAELVNSEPFRTVAQSPPKPSDMTNLMFLGTRQQIESAFQEAGWFAATALSRDSKFKTAQAMIEDRGYQEAPMSILYLGGPASHDDLREAERYIRHAPSHTRLGASSAIQWRTGLACSGNSRHGHHLFPDKPHVHAWDRSPYR